MSDNHDENSSKDKKDEGNLIEAEAVEIIEDEAPDPYNAERDEVELKVVKKWSFMSFLAFIFALGALTLSGYLYYIQEYAKNQVTDNPLWQAPLSALESSLNKRVTDLSKEITILKQNKQGITDDLAMLEQRVSKIKPESNAGNTSQQDLSGYDDGELLQQIAELNAQLVKQKESITALQTAKPADNAYGEKIRNLEAQLSAQASKYDGINQLMLQNKAKSNQNEQSSTKDYQVEMIEDNLYAANKYLLLNQPQQAQKTLAKIQGLLVAFNAAHFKSFINELKGVANEIASKRVDVYSLSKEIDALEFSTNKLGFKSNQDDAQDDKAVESSWYDNLVTIRKVGDSEPLVTQSEKFSIRQSIKTRFGILRVALINQNQELWQTEIDQLIELAQKHFSQNANNVVLALNQLKKKNINPQLPELSTYLQKFRVIHSMIAPTEVKGD
jgi:uncharacterized protein HemX